MDMTERLLLRRLRGVVQNAPDDLTECEAQYLYKTMNRVIGALLDAQEPAHDKSKLHSLASSMIQQLDETFITR